MGKLLLQRPGDDGCRVIVWCAGVPAAGPQGGSSWGPGGSTPEDKYTLLALCNMAERTDLATAFNCTLLISASSDGLGLGV